MLLAIVMESYAAVKEQTQDAVTLMKQVSEMVRRARQSRKGLRVRLNDVYAKLLDEHHHQEDELLHSKENIYLSDLLATVPGIPKQQAERTMLNAQNAWNQ